VFLRHGVRLSSRHAEISLHSLALSCVIPSRNRMRMLLPIFVLAWVGALHAAVIQGAVVEAQTGRPLARTLVVASPVAGTAGTGKSIRTNIYGTFELEGLAAGAYIVTASRRAFATTQY